MRETSSQEITKHPSSLRLRNAAIERWLELRNEHLKWSERMWAGTIALNFTADELKMPNDFDFLSPRDHQLINGVGLAVVT